MTVPPYAVAAVVMSMISYVTDRLQTRGLFMAGSSCIGAIGYMYVCVCDLSSHTEVWQYPLDGGRQQRCAILRDVLFDYWDLHLDWNNHRLVYVFSPTALDRGD